eukprot:CAMPEP_0194147086 /NCGR_PEP_ID=MMETSP0152-20130528/22513_1 /TAXON_ID=1049557 /ORGANISM="Thalassiothrix antarctica, Strain L6-D1" /LENGTH=127 /DNA_ID=CAMNT_0038847775 /DNA_START=96 /DNA_END=475 /DNA_ORIENTATION=-
MASYQDEAQEGEEVPQSMEQLAESAAPSSLRGVRACKRCGILKTMEQFMNEGCENCPFFDMNDIDGVNRYLTAFYEGQAAVMDPQESWAAKWIRVDSFFPGVYAIQVTGALERDIEEDLENRGLRWR